MTSNLVTNRVHIMIAPTRDVPWADDLARSLAQMRAVLHWPRTEGEAIGMAASREMHLGILNANRSVVDGLAVLRRIRRMGIELPCLLVCDEPDRQLLWEALTLEALSVVRADTHRNLLASLLAKAVKRVCRDNGPFDTWKN
ncbi:MAG: hypothetical protein ABII12_03865 [Planctomycetota bacterium]